MGFAFFFVFGFYMEVPHGILRTFYTPDFLSKKHVTCDNGLNFLIFYQGNRGENQETNQKTNKKK